MSDFGFRQTLGVRTLGCTRRSLPYRSTSDPLARTKMKTMNNIGDTMFIQVRATVVVGVLGTGVPRLACLRHAAWLKWGPSVAHLHQHKAQDPREGTSLARRMTWRFLKHGLLRLARKEAERSRRVPHEVPMTQAMTTK